MTPNGHSETDGIRGHKIEYKFEFCWLFNRNLLASPRAIRSTQSAAGGKSAQRFAPQEMTATSWAKHEPKTVRLVTSSNLIDCTTESSLGFLRLSVLPTKPVVSLVMNRALRTATAKSATSTLERDAVCAYGYNHAVQSEMLELYA